MRAHLQGWEIQMGEPAKAKRMKLGIFVLLFLSIFLVVAYYLKKEFWKDIH